MTLVSPTLDESSLVLHRALPKEMLSVSEVNGKRLVRINSSSLGIIQECPRKAYYSLNQKWKAANEAPAFLFGRAIHKALEVYYSGDPSRRILPKIEDVELLAFGHPPRSDGLIESAIHAFCETAKPLSPLPATDKRSLQNGVWILHEYFKAYIDDPWVAYVDESGPFVERQFSLHLIETEELSVEIFGTIDFAFRHLVTGEIILGDHKTSSFLSFGGSSYFDRDKPNHQYTMYALGARRVFGIETDNFMVNVIEVKAKPKTKAAKGVSFPRQITKRTEEDFQETKVAIAYAAYSYVSNMEAQENTKSGEAAWPMGGVDACNKFGGCQFKQICASPRSMRETLLKNKFIQETTT